LLAVLAAAAGAGASSSAVVFQGVDKGLCGFPLRVTVTSRGPLDPAAPTVGRLKLIGPSTVTLRNESTGRAATLDSPGSYSVDTTTGSVTFRGRQVWAWDVGRRVPFATTDGTGTFAAPDFVLRPGSSRARVIDPCGLVAAPASTRPRTTPAPWGLPASALGQIGYAGLIPVLGRIIRHDHVHLDVVVDGRKVTVPGGIGLAEPLDGGACPADPGASGDCREGQSIFAAVANSPLHTHASSGLIHVEADRPGRYTLGQFFAEWGVRFDARCLGGHCTGGGRELRVYVDGRRVTGDPRTIPLRNRREIAVVFGGPDDFRAVPSRYGGGWPGAGCGGPGERSCLPRRAT
jgi:hypothetical protein